MIPFINIKDIVTDQNPTGGYDLLTEKHGCVNGCKCGVSYYRNSEYNTSKVTMHDDQEGFFVLEGYGYALVGDTEIKMEPGVSFMVPAHTDHKMKTNGISEYCKVFWFHASV